MVANGGNVLDAYGYVNVISPSGLPMRAIVGISPDPIMFVAINCKNVRESQEYYQQLGFVEQVSNPLCIVMFARLVFLTRALITVGISLCSPFERANSIRT